MQTGGYCAKFGGAGAIVFNSRLFFDKCTRFDRSTPYPSLKKRTFKPIIFTNHRLYEGSKRTHLTNEKNHFNQPI
ncbi:hypothetical protein Halhy_1189 [Haliscomenobacter hydrossis DSM 1100]|uniref:Uncharacterized protein n=1 Tax=Haliscomenobacter hydrossis (strain ATCC 27775 / DSM 1100 / LMG 10767 / O) TaxID=760192 RepID=F4KSX9_HALH1|nr:hypothetical protein Halhy_1189 [Haliscomenobacter hydrossis DSM 1100]